MHFVLGEWYSHSSSPHKKNKHKLEKALKIVDPPNLIKHKLVSKAAILYGGQKESQRWVDIAWFTRVMQSLLYSSVPFTTVYCKYSYLTFQ